MSFGYGEFDESRFGEPTMQELWKDASVENDLETRSRALVKIAVRLFADGKYWNAIGAAEAANELFKQQGVDRQIAHGFFFIGECHFMMERYADARQAFGYAEDYFINTLNSDGEARSIQMMGYCNKHLREYEVALDCLQRALAMFEQEVDHDACGATALAIAELQDEMGAFEIALQSYARAFKFYQDAENLNSSGHTHIAWGQTLLKMGRAQEALTQFEAAAEVRSFIDAGPIHFEAMYWKGKAQGAIGDSDGALETLAKARGEFRMVSCHYEAANCELARAIILQGLGRFAEAKSLLNTVRAVFNSLGHSTELVETELSLAEIYLYEGNSFAAEELLASNLKLATDKARFNIEFKLRAMLSELYSNRQQYSSALEVMEVTADKVHGRTIAEQARWFNAHATALIGLNRIAEARPLLEKAVALDPSELAPARLARSYELIALSLDFGQADKLHFFAAAAVAYYLKAGDSLSAARLGSYLEPKGPHTALEYLRAADGQLSFFADLDEYRQAS